MTYDDAVEKIEEILRDLINSHNHDHPPEFLTDWILVAAAHVDEPDGESETAYRRMSRHHQPPHATLGLLNYELTKMENFLITDEIDRDG